MFSGGNGDLVRTECRRDQAGRTGFEHHCTVLPADGHRLIDRGNDMEAAGRERIVAPSLHKPQILDFEERTGIDNRIFAVPVRGVTRSGNARNRTVGEINAVTRGVDMSSRDLPFASTRPQSLIRNVVLLFCWISSSRFPAPIA